MTPLPVQKKIKLPQYEILWVLFFLTEWLDILLWASPVLASKITNEWTNKWQVGHDEFLYELSACSIRVPTEDMETHGSSKES